MSTDFKLKNQEMAASGDIVGTTEKKLIACRVKVE